MPSLLGHFDEVIRLEKSIPCQEQPKVLKDRKASPACEVLNAGRRVACKGGALVGGGARAASPASLLGFSPYDRKPTQPSSIGEMGTNHDRKWAQLTMIYGIPELQNQGL